MAGEEVVPGVVVPITADTSGLTQGLDKAGAAVETHSETWKQAGSVVAGIVGVSMLNAVKEYVTTSVREYVKLDLALDRTSRTLMKQGRTYAQAREEVEKYADTVEALTQFTDEEAATSINNVMLKTNDWALSMQINALAMDVVARKGGDLKETANSLTLAFKGNDRGVSQLARQLGIAGPAAKDAGKLFQQLEKDFKGAAAGSTNAYTEFEKLKNEIGNLAEATGQALLPTAMNISVFVRSLLGSEEAKLMDRIRAFKNIAAVTRKNAEFRDAETKARAEREAQRFDNLVAKAETDLARLRKKLPGQEGSLVQGARKNQDDIKAAEDSAEKLAKANKDRAEAAQAAATAEGQALEDLREEQLRFAQTLVGPVASGMEQFFTRVLDGTASMEQAFEALGKAMAKSFLLAIATMLEQEAAAAAARAIASAIAEDYYGAAKHAGASAMYASGAGGVRAVAASLAEGGVVHAAPGGRIVQVAEGGEDEVVSPLSTLKNMMGGTNNITLAFPNVKKSSDLDQGQVATAARRLVGELQRAKSRSGNQYSTI